MTYVIKFTTHYIKPSDGSRRQMVSYYKQKIFKGLVVELTSKITEAAMFDFKSFAEIERRTIPNWKARTEIVKVPEPTT